MKKRILPLLIFLFCMPLFLTTAYGSSRDTLRVGLYYDGTGNTGAAMNAANLENHTGAGFSFGFYNSERAFTPLAATTETKVTVLSGANFYLDGKGGYTTTANGGAAVGSYHLQLTQTYPAYDTANAAAAGLRGKFGTAYAACDNGTFVVRAGNYTTKAAAEDALRSANISAAVCGASAYTVTVVRTGSADILFEYDGGGSTFLGITPRGTKGEKCQTWFRGYRYYGGFEYDRSPALSDGKINVINVVDLEDYVKCVLPAEMSPSWQAEALKAQSICARTYALFQHKHDGKNFDVCATTNCQVYRGASASTASSDAAVDDTKGLALYYNNALIEALFCASNGGASESSENVWSTAQPYLRGKTDPYEATISIPNYTYQKTYTADQLTQLLRQKGYSIGTLASVQPSYTSVGNIASVTFTDTSGKQVRVEKEACRTLFSARSMRFTITAPGRTSVPSSPAPQTAASPKETGTYSVNDGASLGSLGSAYAITSGGAVSKIAGGTVYAITSSGIKAIGDGTPGSTPDDLPTGDTTNSSVPGAVITGDSYVLSGTGNGHNVGMSQYGANAMAQQGKTYREILNFYYTGITIQ